MWNKIKALFGDGEAGEAPAAPLVEDRVRLAAAGLLAKVALSDGTVAAVERARMETVLADRFDLTAEEAAALVEESETTAAQALDLFQFTKLIVAHVEPENRVRIIEMLWEVVYADGVLDDHEGQVMRRLAGLLFVPDRDSGAARKRVMARLQASQ